MSNFGGGYNLLPHLMHINISVDPDTHDYDVEIRGSLNVLKAVLHQVLDDLEKQDVIDQLTVSEE